MNEYYKQMLTIILAMIAITAIIVMLNPIYPDTNFIDNVLVCMVFIFALVGNVIITIIEDIRNSMRQ